MAARGKISWWFSFRIKLSTTFSLVIILHDAPLGTSHISARYWGIALQGIRSEISISKFLSRLLWLKIFKKFHSQKSWNMKLIDFIHCPWGNIPPQRKDRKFRGHPRDFGVFEKSKISHYKPEGAPRVICARHNLGKKTEELCWLCHEIFHAFSKNWGK